MYRESINPPPVEVDPLIAEEEDFKGVAKAKERGNQTVLNRKTT